jgi:hypothetical protein
MELRPCSNFFAAVFNVVWMYRIRPSVSSRTFLQDADDPVLGRAVLRKINTPGIPQIDGPR